MILEDGLVMIYRLTEKLDQNLKVGWGTGGEVEWEVWGWQECEVWAEAPHFFSNHPQT